MTRLPIPITSILAVLVFLAVTAVWVRSYVYGDDIFFVFDDGCEHVALVRGRVLVQHYRAESGRQGKLLRVRHRVQAVGAMSPEPWPRTLEKYPWIGVRFIDIPSPNPVHPGLPGYWAAIAPYSLLAVPFLLWPGAWLVRGLRRMRRWRNHHCPDCGYNLRGNTSGVCPECGARMPLKESVFNRPDRAAIR